MFIPASPQKKKDPIAPTSITPPHRGTPQLGCCGSALPAPRNKDPMLLGCTGHIRSTWQGSAQPRGSPKPSAPPAGSRSSLSRVSRPQPGDAGGGSLSPPTRARARRGPRRGGCRAPGTAGEMKCELPAGAPGSWRCRMRPGWPRRPNGTHVCGLRGEAALGNRALRRPGGCILSKSPGPT